MDAVYEGRLPAQPVVGENRLDVTMSAAVVRRLPEVDQAAAADVVDVEAELGAGGVAGPEAWVPWCPECRLQPVGGPWSLDCAQYLATAHDAVHHHGSWTARPVRAEQVPAAAACLPAGTPGEAASAAAGGVR